MLDVRRLSLATTTCWVAARLRHRVMAPHQDLCFGDIQARDTP